MAAAVQAGIRTAAGRACVAAGRPEDWRTVSTSKPHGCAPRMDETRLTRRLCQRCGGSGTEIFFLFDDGPCRQCRGVGRVF